MGQVRVIARLVDGSALDFEFDAAWLEELRDLQREGWSGRRLINRLITDDWGPPPNSVEVSGVDQQGCEVSFVVPYT